LSFDRLVVVDWSARSKPSAKTLQRMLFIFVNQLTLNFKIQNIFELGEKL